MEKTAWGGERYLSFYKHHCQIKFWLINLDLPQINIIFIFAASLNKTFQLQAITSSIA